MQFLSVIEVFSIFVLVGLVFENQSFPHSVRVKRSSKGIPWPTGVVFYVRDKSVTESDNMILVEAFKEFESKTCVRFQPWLPGLPHFISIEIHELMTCGESHVCMRDVRPDGYQFVKIAKNCRNLPTFIHELGHSVCLRHPHERQDRDNHVLFNGCVDQPVVVNSININAIYDFNSQMNYKCFECSEGFPIQSGNVRGCGETIQDRLSAMDVDKINALYMCQGCLRHRWIPLNEITDSTTNDLPKLQVFTEWGADLIPCRVGKGNEIMIGHYDIFYRVCVVITDSLEVETFSKYAEVLSVPNNGIHSGERYRFVDHASLTTANNHTRIIEAGEIFNECGEIHKAAIEVYQVEYMYFRNSAADEDNTTFTAQIERLPHDLLYKLSEGNFSITRFSYLRATPLTE